MKEHVRDAASEAAIRAELIAIEQTVAQWETRKTLERLRALVTMDQVERVRAQGENVLERVNLLVNSSQVGMQKMDAMRSKLNQEAIPLRMESVHNYNDTTLQGRYSV